MLLVMLALLPSNVLLPRVSISTAKREKQVAAVAGGTHKPVEII